MHGERLFILLVASSMLVAGCVGFGGGEEISPASTELIDEPLQSVADAYYDVPGGQPYPAYMASFLASGVLGGDVRFHTFEEVGAKLEAWEQAYPGFIELDVIGESHEGRPIWRVVVTDESVTEAKMAPLLDGGHHGNEYGGSEIMLYTVDFLLANLDNATVQEMLTELEIHVVPIVNPDGYVEGTRYNGFGVNLNRNYDVDWGNPAGTSNPIMGTLAEALGTPFPGVTLAAENCGSAPFSEPETQAIRDVMAELGDRAAFYLTGHTPTHAVIAPPAAFDPPFQVPDHHRSVLDEELEWIRDNTEYEAGRAQWGDMFAGLPYAASGSSMDYFYATLDKPAFTVEVEYFASSVTAEDYPERMTEAYEGLRFWMDATLPLPMHLLANAADLADWEEPSRAALLPADHPETVFPERESPLMPYLH